MHDRDRQSKKDRYFTFQSGYIQIVDITASEQIETNLYIPVWLYSNGQVAIYLSHHKNLYIPIWLYSNRGAILS